MQRRKNRRNSAKTQDEHISDPDHEKQTAHHTQHIQSSLEEVRLVFDAALAVSNPRPFAVRAFGRDLIDQTVGAAYAFLLTEVADHFAKDIGVDPLSRSIALSELVKHPSQILSVVVTIFIRI